MFARLRDARWGPNTDRTFVPDSSRQVRNPRPGRDLRFFCVSFASQGCWGEPARRAGDDRSVSGRRFLSLFLR